MTDDINWPLVLWCGFLALLGIAALVIAIMAVWSTGLLQTRLGNTAIILGATWAILTFCTAMANA